MNIPVKHIDINGQEITHEVEVNLIDNVRKDEKFISSMQYVPDFQQDTGLFKDATKLLDRLVTDADDETLKEINQAYCDTLYKWSAYDKLSYGAKITMLQEKGFDYVLDLLLHMYDEDYNAVKTTYENLINGKITPADVNTEYIENKYIVISDTISIISYDDFVQKNANESLTKLTALFNLINSLKGKTLGLELVLQLIDMPEYFFLPWNVIINDGGEWGSEIEELPLETYQIVNGESKAIINGEIEDGAVIKNVKAGLGFTKTVGETINHFIYNGVSWHACSSFDDYTTPREPLTAILDVYGASSTSLQKHLSTFVRSYMLPLIEVTIRFTATMPVVYAIPSGVYKIYDELIMEYYDDISGEHHQNLIHKLSDEHWYSDSFHRQQLCFGIPEFEENGFDGTVNLSKSYVQDIKGNKYWLYGSDPTIASILNGTALDKITTEGIINNYEGDYIQAPLDKYIEIDIETGEQQNPHYSGDEFVRDTLIKYYKCLTIEGIHLAKRVEEIEELLIEDFEKEYNEIEVYLGMETKLNCESGKDHNALILDVLNGKKAEHNAELLALGIPQSAIDEYITQYAISHDDNYTFYQQFIAKREVDGLLEEFNVSLYNEVSTILNTLKTYPVIKCDNTANANQTLKDCLNAYNTPIWKGKNILTIAEYNEISGVIAEVNKCETLSGISVIDYPIVQELLNLIIGKSVRDLVTKTSTANSKLLGFSVKFSKMIGESFLTTPQYQEILGVLEEIQTYQKFNQYKNLDILSDITPFYEFTCNEPEIREEVGSEDTHLVFCEATLDECYTGIGDLGILGANDYFIYNGMLFYHNDEIIQIGNDKTWTDVGASHAVSDTYYTPAINNGKLVAVKGGDVLNVARSEYIDAYISYLKEHPQIVVDALGEMTVDDVNDEVIRTYIESWTELSEYWDEAESSGWTAITGYVNEFYTAFGISDGRLYKIFEESGMLFYEIMDDEQGWEYITGVAYAETYEAYGIKNGILYRISADEITEIVRQDNKKISGIEHVTQTTTETSDKFVYETLTNDSVEIDYTIETYGEGEYAYTVKNLTGIKFNNVSQTITENLDNIYLTENVRVVYSYNQLVSINVNAPKYNAILEFTEGELTSYEFVEDNTLKGWDSSFDCISRYHHCNDAYTTYGICNGKLYSICNETLTKLDTLKTWTAVCGFYNDNSPRTFAYAIADGNLYELKGNTFTQVNNSSALYWTEIHGCTTATNNFVLGIGKTSPNDIGGYLYKINAKTLSKLDTSDKWTTCFGRYTTSTATSNLCYGYGVKNNKLYQVNKEGISIVSGFWKVNGEGDIIDIADYDITQITLNLPDGSQVTGVQNIKEIAPIPNTSVEDYDIYISYVTRGFNNNERYTVRTELEETNYLYVHPEECRTDVSETNCLGLFDVNTGLMTDFTKRNVIENGIDIIEGSGYASRFDLEETYLTLPDEEIMTFVAEVEFCCTSTQIKPLILDEESKTGIFFGFKDAYGLILRKDINDTLTDEVILETNQNELKRATIKYSLNNGHYDIYVNGTKVFSSSNNSYVYAPKNLGGNGTIYSDGAFYLADSYIINTNSEKTYLFENGKYFSLSTQLQDIIEVLTTKDTQGISKVIEVIKEDNEVLEFAMDTLYTQMIPTSDTLTVSTDFNVNEIKSDKYEGITYSTLTYNGAYLLDESKVTANTALDDNICHFSHNGIVNNLNGSIKKHLRLSTDVNTPIYIKTGNVVDNQYLFVTEENEAFTNKLLLKSKVTGISDVAGTFVPKGIIYELNSNKVGTVSRTLTYNGQSFELDPEKIEEYSRYYFDNYNTTLTFYPQYNYIEIEDEEGTHYEQEYVDAYAIIHLDTDGEVSNGYMNITNKIKINSTTANQKFMVIDDLEYTTRAVGEYYYKFDIKKKFDRLNTDLVTEYNPVTEEKDKLHYEDGQCWNFSEKGYFKLTDITSNDGFMLCVIMDDDASKDQGIFGCPNNYGFGIKDNMWTVTDNNGTAHKTTVEVKDYSKKYIAFRKNGTVYDIYISDDNRYWDLLYEGFKIFANSYIGYANVAGEMLAFNGTIDLAQSRIEDTNERIYLMDQTTKVSISLDDETWEELDTFHTLHSVSTINMGYEFTGNLDCYYSKLLKSYDLGWVYNRIPIDTAIKNEIRVNDSTYYPSEDEHYDITEYGIYLDAEPKRWDNITVTYTTTDAAFYLKPNKDYIVGMDTVEDNESGKYLVDIVGNPSWNNGIFSDFENGYITYDFRSGYTVIKLKLNGDNQGIACYDDESDDTPPSIYIQNGIIKYFDNENVYELFTPEQDELYLKLYTDYTTDREIEYSYDGETWNKTLPVNFSGYEKFALGKAYIDGVESRFNGEINVAESYYYNNTPTALFQYYKKIVPYIIEDGVKHAITLEPLLTIRDYVIFMSAFNGSIDMYKSNLVMPDTRYWEANQIKVYENINGVKGNLLDTVIRDAVDIEADKYITENSKVRVNPTDLQVYFPEIPQIGDVITLTYNTWYMFREKDTTYNFKITYDGNNARISYKKEDSIEYTLYITERQNFVVNTGFQFNGIFVVKDSTRGGMTLTYPDIWNTYLIKYKKQTEDEWHIWDRFILANTSLIYQRMGYELLGTHYLATSWLKTEAVETPFVSFYNNRFIRPVGAVSFATDQSGIVSNFSKNGYLEVIMDELEEGWKVFFWVTTGETENQGLCTWVRGENGYFISNNDKELNKFRPNYTYIVRYKFGDEGLTVYDVDIMRLSNLEQTLIRMFAADENKITVSILGYNLGDNPYTPQKPLVKNVTIIPYNPKKKVGDTGYYITTAEQASRVKISYRKMKNRYDHFTEEGLDTWYSVPLELMTVNYGWETLQVYGVKVPFGYSQGLSLNNSTDYYIGEMVEFKVKSDITTYNSFCPYNDMTFLQRAVF